MRNTMICTLAGVFIASFAAGCSPGENIAGTPLPSTKSSESTATSTAAPRRSISEGAFEYSRTGGVTGTDERWRFFSDGRVVDAQGVEYEIPETEIASLLEEIEALGFYDWEVGRNRLGSCADCFTYTISAHNDGQSNQLSFVDAQADVPEGIWTILEGIQGLLEVAVEVEST